MAKRFAGGLAVLVMAAVSGCGTTMNLAEGSGPFQFAEAAGPRVYGGVRYDAAMGSLWLLGGFLEPALAPLGLYVLAVDMPLSFIGDTLTLPWTVGAAVDRLCGLPHFPVPPTPVNPLSGPGPMAPVAAPPSAEVLLDNGLIVSQPSAEPVPVSVQAESR